MVWSLRAPMFSVRSFTLAAMSAISSIESLEKEIETFTAEKERLDHLLSDANIYEDGNKEALKAALIQQAKAAEQLHHAEEAWLEQNTALEALLEA